MKRILLFTALLLSSGLSAQTPTTGTFSVSSQNDKYLVSGSDMRSTYGAIVFNFPVGLKNTAINFVEGTNPQKTVFASQMNLGVSIGSPTPAGYAISISGSAGQYVVKGIKGTLPDNFSILVGGQLIGPFSLTSSADPGPPSLAGYQPGHILYDALYMSQNPSKKDSIRDILLSYRIDSSAYARNAYLSYTLGDIFTKIHGMKPPVSAASLISSMGSLDVTSIADGFARFIVQRTKQELNVAFFNEFYKTLEKPEYVDLRTVFPETYGALKVIGDQIYMYNAYLQILRESFEKDLSDLPDNLPSIIENHAGFFNKRPDLKTMLESSFYLAEQIRDRQHPGSIIHNFPADEMLGENNRDTNLVASVKTVQLVSRSLKGKNETDRYWAPEADVQKLFADEKAFIIYLGLLEQQSRNDSISFNIGKDSVLLGDILDKAFPKYTIYKPYIKSLYTQIKGIENKVALLKNVSSDSMKVESYYSIVNASLQLMEQVSQVEQLPGFPSHPGFKKKNAASYFYMVRKAADLVVDVNRKNYASAVLDAVQIYDTVFTPSAIADIDSSKLVQNVKEFMFKYGTFMANICMAQNSDEVEAAIEAIALPAGSSTIKRQTAFNVSLNAYCGVYGGYERIKGVDPQWTTTKNAFANSYGVTAPIGLAISTGCHGWSHSVFFSVVDIGALTAFRFANDSTETVPTIKLQNIVSPGLFYSLGVKGTPLSVNLGYQVGPLLRKVTTIENDYSQNYSRLSLSLCVDIPLVNFYTKSKVVGRSKASAKKNKPAR